MFFYRQFSKDIMFSTLYEALQIKVTINTLHEHTRATNIVLDRG